MIVAVVLFVAAGQPVLTMRARETFDTLDACEAFLASEQGRIAGIAADASMRTGMIITHISRCIPRGQET
jgi:hypothetical protein